MSELLLNNFFLFLGSYFVAGFSWIGINRIGRPRIRRALKATTIFFILPIVYPGHPVLFFQPWMLLLMFIEQFKFQPIAIYLIVWGVIVGVSQFGVKQQNAF